MDLIRQYEFFNPEKVDDEIHIIGIGAIGSHVAEMLVRMGITNLTLYDFDTVDLHNIPNQMYMETQVEKTKCEALMDTLKAINPEVEKTITLMPKGYEAGIPLTGYVFLCVDSINLRRAIVEEHYNNPNIIAMFDYRMALSSAQHYAARWLDESEKQKFIKSMQFTDEEAKEAMPISACGTALSVLPTIRMITAAGVANWMNLIKQQTMKTFIMIDAFAYNVVYF